MTLTLTTTGNGICNAHSDDMVITITPAPTVDAGPAIICATSTTIALSGTITVATGAVWSSTGTGTFTPDPTSLVATYELSPADELLSSLVITLTTTGNGTCNAYSDDITLNITSAPQSDAGPDQVVCADITGVTMNGDIQNAGGGIWSTSGTGTFDDDTDLNATYFPSADDTTAGSVIITLTTTDNGPCDPVTDQMVITFTPAPTVTAGPATVCSNVGIVPLNGSVTVATGGTWTTSGNGTFDDPNLLATNYNVSGDDETAGSVILRLTTTGNGDCNAYFDEITLWITEAPEALPGPDQIVCADLPEVQLNGAVVGAGGGTWTTSGTGTFSDPDDLNATYTPSADDRTAGTVILTLTTTDNGNCNAVFADMTITITPAPTIDAGPDQTVCADVAGVSLNGSVTVATGGTWITSGDGAFSDANILNPVYTPSLNDRNAGSVTLTLTSTGNGDCQEVSDQMVITITPAPTVDAGPPSICTNATSVSLNGVVTVATGGLWTTSGNGSFAPNASTLNALYVISNDDRNDGSVTLTLTTTGNGTCIPVSDDIVINIVPPPVVNAGADQTHCADIGSVQLTGSVTGNATGGVWTSSSVDGTFDPDEFTINARYFPSATDIAAGTVTLTLTSVGHAPCDPGSDQMVLTLTPAPTAVVNAGNDTTICATSTDIQLQGEISVATGVQWTTTGSGIFSPSPFVLDPIYIPDDNDVDAGSVLLILQTTGNGTCNPVTDTMELTIAPRPAPNAGPNQTVCADVASVTLNGTVDNAMGGFWTSSGSGSFSPDPNTLVVSYIPSVGDIADSVVFLTLFTTGNGVCDTVFDNTRIYITPRPTINAGFDQIVCADNGPVTLSANVTVATGGTWTTTGDGVFSQPDSLNTTYTMGPTDISINGGATLTITSTGNGTCNPVTDDLVLTITPAPTVSAGPPQTVCADVSGVALNGSVTVASGGFWTTSGSGTFSPSAATLNATYILSSADTAAGSVTLTLTSTGNGNCNAVSDDVVITITPAPTINAGPDQTVCADLMDIPVSGMVTTATGGTWTTSGSGTFDDANDLNTTYSPSPTDISNGIVILTLTSTGHGTCNAVNDNLRITITPAPTANTGADRIVCGNNADVSLTGSVTVATGGTWSGGTGTFSPDENTLNATYTPSAAEITAGTVTLTLTTTGNGTCMPVTDDLLITITPAPEVDAGGDQIECGDISFINLGGSVTVASGGVWTSSGTGVFSPDANTLGGSYFPSDADKSDGLVTLTLTSTGNGSCLPVSSEMELTLTPVPTVNAGIDQTVCGNNAEVNLDGNVTIATGGIWSGGNGNFDPAPDDLNAVYTPSATEIASGTVILTLTSTGNGTCNPVSDQMIITITPSTLANAGADRTVCANNAALTLNGSVSVATGGTWSGGTGTFIPDENTLNAQYIPSDNEITAGTVTLILTTTGNGSCLPAVDDMTITITPAPTVDAGIDETVCSNNANVTLSGSFTISTGASWSTSGSGTFAPSGIDMNAVYTPSGSDISAGIVTIVLSTTGNGNCLAVRDTMEITITPPPVADAGPDQTVCTNNADVILAGSVTISGGGTWTGGAGTFDPDANALDAVYSPTAAERAAGLVVLTLTTTDNGTCNPVSDNMRITITPAPTVNAGADQTVCANNAEVALNGSVTIANGGTWSGGDGTYNPGEGNLNITYTPSADEIAAGFVILTLETTGNGDCLPEADNMTITITPAPTSDAGSDQTVCADIASVALNGAVSIATGGVWTTSGSGEFFPNANTLDAEYIPSSADTAFRLIGLTLTTTGNGNCLEVSSSMTLTITPAPTVSAGPDQDMCIDNAEAFVQGSRTVATGSVWSTLGSGTFENPNNLTTSYAPSADDRAVGAVILRLTTTGNGTCNTYEDEMILMITPAPTVNAGPDLTICADGDVQLDGVVTIAEGGEWTSGGTGYFLPDANTLNAVYVPSNADTTAGSVLLTLTTTGNGKCNPYSDDITITITPVPIVSTGNSSICADFTGAELDGIVYHATGGVWSTSGTGEFFPNEYTLNATYVPSQADMDAGIAVLTITSDGHGSCNPVSADFTLIITPLPVADAGEDIVVCRGDGRTLVAVIEPDVSYRWFAMDGASISQLAMVDIVANTDTAFVLMATDNKGCSVYDTVIVFVTDPPDFNLAAYYCFEQGLVLDSDPMPVPADGMFQWYRNDTLLFERNNSTINATQPGVYAISHNYGYCTVYDTTEVIVPPVISSEDALACIGVPAVIRTTLIPQTTYEWTNNDVVVGDADTLVVTVSGDEEYIVQVTDIYGCSSFDTVLVTSTSPPQITLADVSACIGETVSLNGEPANIPGNSQSAYEWFRDGEVLPETTPVIYTTIPGNYTMLYSIGLCNSNGEANVSFHALPVTEVEDTVKYCMELDGATSLNGGPGHHYLWLTDPTETNKEIEVYFPGYYYVQVYNEFNCYSTDSIYVKDVCPPRVFVPNAFNPGSADPADRVFKIFGDHYANFRVTVFNRWGEIIFYSEDPKFEWDGYYRGEPMPIGSYNYIITYGPEYFEFPEFKNTRLEGRVTLIR